MFPLKRWVKHNHTYIFSLFDFVLSKLSMINICVFFYILPHKNFIAIYDKYLRSLQKERGKMKTNIGAFLLETIRNN